jgi:uncharacterized protein involved in copper resistance
MTFKQAVNSSRAIAAHYRDGLRAVKGVDRKRMRASGRRVTGSVNLEDALRRTHANEPIWDYGIGIRHTANGDRVIWVEVHGANNRHVGDVLQKHSWLTAWLSREAQDLKAISTTYVWLATGRVYINPDTPERRRLSQAGIALKAGALDLDSY